MFEKVRKFLVNTSGDKKYDGQIPIYASNNKDSKCKPGCINTGEEILPPSKEFIKEFREELNEKWKVVDRCCGGL